MDKIFMVDLKKWDRFIVQLYLFILILAPRIFRQLISIADFEFRKFISYTIISIIIIPITYQISKRIKNVHITIMLSVTLCTIYRFIYEVAIGKEFYAGVAMTAMYVLSLLYLWTIVSNRKVHYLLVIIIGLICAELVMTYTRMLYFDIQIGNLNRFFNYAKNTKAILNTGFLHSVLATILFYIFGINKLLKKNKS